MIRKVTIRRFKRFDEAEFEFRGHVVLADPNDCGKTSLLQALAACSLALSQWKTLNNYHRRGGGYAWKPITRQAFSAVPLRSFDLLWTKRKYRDPIDIAIVDDRERALRMEFKPDRTEQIYVRPKNDSKPAAVEAFNLRTAYIPSMSCRVGPGDRRTCLPARQTGRSTRQRQARLRFVCCLIGGKDRVVRS